MMKTALLLAAVIACCGALSINMERQGRAGPTAGSGPTTGAGPTAGSGPTEASVGIVGIVECSGATPDGLSVSSSTAETSNCGDAATSYYQVIEDGSTRIVATSGIPYHDHKAKTPNEACEKWSYMTLPQTPTKGSTFTASAMGPVGTAVSGAFFYNHKGNRQGTGDVAAYTEANTFDDCNGHADFEKQYHYHKIPVCIPDYDDCGLMGYYQDGFPVYGLNCKANDGGELTSCYYLKDGGDSESTSDYEFNTSGYASGDCNLDEANGYDFTAGYAYVFTEAYPFIMPGYYGSVASAKCKI